MIKAIQQGLKADGFEVPITKLCHWFGVVRRSVYYKPSRATPKVDPAFAEPIKALIEEEPYFGYRTVANLLGFNKNTVQRIFKLKGWQVRKRPVENRPRMEAVPSVATAPDQRWATDLCCIWGGREGLAIEVGRRLRGENVVEVLNKRVRLRGAPKYLFAETGAEFTGQLVDLWAYHHGTRIDFSRPGKPTDNAFIETFNGTLRDECLNIHWFGSINEAKRLIEAWRIDYNESRPHMALGNKTPSEYCSYVIPLQQAEGLRPAEN